MIRKIASDVILDEAFGWLCQCRKDYSPNNDVWDLRRNWDRIKPELQKILLAGDYTFQPLAELRLTDEIIEMWSARDALVLKALAMVLSKHLEPILSGRCYHVAGRGGAKAAVRAALEASRGDVHLMKSDIKDYYASMDHIVLFELMERQVTDRMVLRLVWGYLKRTVCFGENYREVTRGISLGCPLSPLMGALYLLPLDEAMDQRGWFYARFMDDWIIITSGRWKLRQAVSCVNQLLSVLRVEKHPDKTFIGKACRGFDFLGYYFLSGTISVSRPALRRFAERITRLYEQGADTIRVEQYVRRWGRWVRAGVASIKRPRLAAVHFLVPIHPIGVALTVAGLPPPPPSPTYRLPNTPRIMVAGGQRVLAGSLWNPAKSTNPVPPVQMRTWRSLFPHGYLQDSAFPRLPPGTLVGTVAPSILTVSESVYLAMLSPVCPV